MNLAGLLVNLWLTPLVAGSPMLVPLLPSSVYVYISVLPPCSRVWSLFIVFTLLHLLANYRAVSVVCMETLNKNRSHSLPPYPS